MNDHPTEISARPIVEHAQRIARGPGHDAEGGSVDGHDHARSAPLPPRISAEQMAAARRVLGRVARHVDAGRTALAMAPLDAGSSGGPALGA